MKKSAQISKKIEQKILAGRQSSEWDKALDKGRVKKTLSDKAEKAAMLLTQSNSFQAMQNERGDKKEYSHSSYESNKKAKNMEKSEDNGEYDHGREGGGRGRGRGGREGGRGGGREGGRGGGRGRGREGGRGGGGRR
jgi:hypothetical protein